MIFIMRSKGPRMDPYEVAHLKISDDFSFSVA